MLEIIIVVLSLLIVYQYIENEKIRKEYFYLDERYEYYRQSHNKIDEDGVKNKERIELSEIKFDNMNFLVIKDTLDINGDRGINIYLLEKSIELCDTEGWHLIAQIDLYDECMENRIIYKIDRIMVEKEYRKKKIATKLMQRVVEWAKMRNIDELDLTAFGGSDFPTEKLIDFYSKFDFKIIESNQMKWKRIN